VTHQDHWHIQFPAFGQQVFNVVQEFVERFNVSASTAGLPEATIVEAKRVNPSRSQESADMLVAPGVLANAVNKEQRRSWRLCGPVSTEL